MNYCTEDEDVELEVASVSKFHNIEDIMVERFVIWKGLLTEYREK